MEYIVLLLVALAINGALKLLIKNRRDLEEFKTSRTDHNNNKKEQ